MKDEDGSIHALAEEKESHGELDPKSDIRRVYRSQVLGRVCKINLIARWRLLEHLGTVDYGERHDSRYEADVWSLVLAGVSRCGLPLVEL